MVDKTREIIIKILYNIEKNGAYSNIALNQELDQARREYESALRDEEEKRNKALMHFREMQRDAGLLRNGGMYYPLTVDPIYQEAKKKVSSPEA